MKLEPKLAQTIVNKMMDQVPYNINMMNEIGLIIASGNPERLNTLHVGAQMAIQQQQTLTMEKEYGVHGRPGINMPVFFNNQIVGVIGITGNPAEVRPLASLLRTATELLLSQSEQDRHQREIETNRNNFIFQWTHSSNIRGNEQLIQNGRQLAINILKPRTAIAFHAQPNLTIRIDSADIIVPISHTTKIVLTEFPKNVDQLIDFCNINHIPAGIGTTTVQVDVSISQSIRTLKINQIMQFNRYRHYQDIQFVDQILTSKPLANQLRSRLNGVASNPGNAELMDTLTAYVANDQSVDLTAKSLHVHRNTLNYRLNKIKDLTGLDPHDVLDLLQLFTGYLSTQL